MPEVTEVMENAPHADRKVSIVGDRVYQEGEEIPASAETETEEGVTAEETTEEEITAEGETTTESETEEEVTAEGETTTESETEEEVTEEEETTSEEETTEEEVTAEETKFDPAKVTIDVDGEEKPLPDVLKDYNALKDAYKDIMDDEFLKNFITHYKTTGDAEEYLQAKAVDWDKKTDIEVIKTKLEKEFSDLDEETRSFLINDALLNKYSIDLTGEESFSETAMKKGEAYLKRDAREARANFKAEQDKFKLPEPKQPEGRDDTKAQEELAKWKQTVDNDEATKTVLETSMLELSTGENKGYAYEVSDPKSVVESAMNPQSFFNLFSTKDGKTDLKRWYKAVAYAQDPTAFEESLVNHGKTLEREAYLKEQKNTKGKAQPKAGTPAPAKDEKDRLLEAFQTKGRKISLNM